MSTDEIVVEHLTKQYKRLRAVDDLSFSVRTGRVTGFLGPNGAGKTTTLRMLLGLVTPTSGQATFGGTKYVDLHDPLKHVGAVLEASSAHRGRTGRNHLRMICRAAGLPDSRADEVLTIVGLTPAANRKFKGYSLGMRQRLGIAAALLGDPRVLILDEPANGLDPEGIRWMRDLLKALASEGRTVLVSSHLLGEMQLLADDVVIVAAGKLIRQGPVDEVLGTMGTGAHVRVRTPQAAELKAALSELNATATEQSDGSLMVVGAEAAAIGHAAFTASVELHELATERGDLEQVFLQLTAGKAGIR
ncbi:ABC transporter ATP-binding protein [Paractinoplanes atraurantiacus]|uniref:ABC-2 type transport system ATP-binding protein n=1 Tax=Paractinoplanes atraurantiacus TaxID=1036182 RepID=A0A285F9I2_9ACTN|nr:ABC transporter ATP-binding protein [Actinoplanes atraurantiacus]SNY07990.1 ABC-2 type transport system ATP-binding protein [Actinoplanes atraurantiacus]